MKSGPAGVGCYTGPVLLPRRRLRSLAWFALVAMVVLALAPGASRAAAAHGGDPWRAVCSSSGLLPASPADGGGALASPDHCPLCSQFGHAPALPVQEAPFAMPDLGEAVAVVERTPPCLRPGRSRAQPRGPPPQA
jgi:hypothetical protein